MLFVSPTGRWSPAPMGPSHNLQMLYLNFGQPTFSSQWQLLTFTTFLQLPTKPQSLHKVSLLNTNYFSILSFFLPTTLTIAGFIHGSFFPLLENEIVLPTPCSRSHTFCSTLKLLLLVHSFCLSVFPSYPTPHIFNFSLSSKSFSFLS